MFIDKPVHIVYRILFKLFRMLKYLFTLNFKELAREFYMPVKRLRIRRQEHKQKLCEEIWRKKAYEVEQSLENLNLSESKGIVYIFQYSYFTQDGSKYISGGAERYVTDLAYLIDRLGYQPILVQWGNKDDKQPWVKIHEKNIVIGVNCDIGDYSKVITCLSEKSLHIYSGFDSYSIKKLFPNIVISHGITWDHPVFNVELTWIKEVLLSTNTLVSVDTSTLCFLRSTFSHDLGQMNIRMHYVPNYTDLSRYKPKKRVDDGRVHIVFPRRCTPERGFWLTAEIIPKILRKYPQVDFQFIGFVHAQDMANEIQRLTKRYPNRISQRFVEADKMHEVYQNADISLIPTLYSEGTSLSCIEAMACGNAVIATDIGGLPDLVINGYNGLLISPDSESLYAAICKLVDDPLLCKKIGENAVQVAQCFSKSTWEASWNRILREYCS